MNAIDPFARTMGAIENLRRDAEENRRHRSLLTFGHSGAHIPGHMPTLEREVAAAIRSWEEAHGRPNPWWGR